MNLLWFYTFIDQLSITFSEQNSTKNSKPNQFEGSFGDSSASNKNIVARVKQNIPIVDDARARQGAQVHIFAAALLEHLCSLYEKKPDMQKKLMGGKL